MKKIILSLFTLGFVFLANDSNGTVITRVKSLTFYKYNKVVEAHDWVKDIHSLKCTGIGMQDCAWTTLPTTTSLSIEQGIENSIGISVASNQFSGGGIYMGYTYSFTYDQTNDVLEYTYQQ